MIATMWSVALFVIGVVLAVWATERLLDGLVSLAGVLKLSAFGVGAVLSGFEVENVAVGLAAGARDAAPIALGTVFGGAIFLVCVALGIGALLFPLEVRLPRRVIAIFAASPLLAGLGLVAPITPRWVGVLLLVAFAAALIILVRASRGRNFLVSEEIQAAQAEQRPLWQALGLTAIGLVAIGIGGDLVAQGAQRIIADLGVSPLLMGMIVAPAAIELEEVFRQAIPSRHGRHDVSAGNLIGTLLYFVLFNFGLIAVITPVAIDPQIRYIDWPVLMVVTVIAATCLWRGRVGRGAGGLLLGIYALYVALRIVLC